MNISKIYKEFDGDFPACEGKKCKESCCLEAQKTGIDIFPDEVLFLLKKYPKEIPVSLRYEKESGTGFLMSDCLSHEKGCQLQEDRPLFCRCYPLRPEKISGGKYKLFLHYKCPKWREVENIFYQKAANSWYIALKKWNRNILKKIWVRFCLWRRGS